MKKANVSVVMCTYNGARFLREQMDSVLNQTYPIHEIIVQDDCSEDKTMDILEEYAAIHENIKLFRNISPKGVNDNFYTAMRKATGNYIAVCDQDDIWETDKIELQMEFIGDKLLCTGVSRPFSEDGSFVYYDKRLPNCNLLRMIYAGMCPGHTLLFKTGLLELLPEGCVFVSKRCYDVVLSVLAASYDSIVYVNKVLVNQRRYVEATTYVTVADSVTTKKNILNKLRLLSHNYYNYRMVMSSYIKNFIDFLEKINSDSEIKKETLRLCRLHISNSFSSFIKLELCCLKNRRYIFYTNDDGVERILRALMFPITSCFYFRGRKIDK